MVLDDQRIRQLHTEAEQSREAAYAKGEDDNNALMHKAGERYSQLIADGKIPDRRKPASAKEGSVRDMCDAVKKDVMKQYLYGPPTIPTIPNRFSGVLSTAILRKIFS